MKGVVKQIARNGSRWMIVKGEDGIKYFIGKDALINPKQYKRYAYTGNIVVFDKDTSQEWRLPHGCNATLAEIADPHKEEKRIRGIEREQRRIENEERKRQNREKNELLRTRAEQRREYEASNTWYWVQRFDGETWKPVCSTETGLPLRYRDSAEAKDKAKELRITNAEARFRIAKSIGMAMTVKTSH